MNNKLIVKTELEAQKNFEGKENKRTEKYLMKGSGARRIPVISFVRGVAPSPAAVGCCHGGRGDAPARGLRKRRWRAELVLGREGALVLRDVGLWIPVVQVAGASIDEPSPWLRQSGVLRRVARRRSSSHGRR